MNREQLYAAALSRGCLPIWYDGIFGPAWHCTCKDNRHGCDLQCSMITIDSLIDLGVRQ